MVMPGKKMEKLNRTSQTAAVVYGGLIPGWQAKALKNHSLRCGSQVKRYAGDRHSGKTCDTNTLNGLQKRKYDVRE